MEEYKNGDHSDPPIKKISNPTLLPILLRCHCLTNFHSLVRGGRKCHFGCRVDGKQYPLGQCPVCKCNCTFVCDRTKYVDMKRRYEMLRMKEDTTADEREEANTYLDRACRFGRETEADIADEGLTPSPVMLVTTAKHSSSSTTLLARMHKPFCRR